MNHVLPTLALTTLALLAGCQSTPSAALSETEAIEAPESATVPASGSDVAENAFLGAQALNAWPVLKAGSSGADVRALQYLLNAHGSALTADGQFGPATTSAVRSFQSRSGLGVDGVVGSATWGRVIVTVQQGSTGNAVRGVQQYLGIAVDGQFGSGTASAVRSFQSRSGLSADGVVGPNSWQALVAGTSGSGGGTTSRATLARQILASSRITLSRSSSTTNGSPYQTILDTSRGLAATSGCHGNANCGAKVYLSATMLAGVLRVANSYRLSINSTTGSGEHVATSYHYRGRAIDVSAVNGVGISASNPYFRGLMASCRSAGATEVLGPGNDGHSTHVHCAW